MRRKKFTAFPLAGAYIGTVVGSGFASGQEIFQFFAVFGGKGLAGLGLAAALLTVFGYVIMELGRKLAARSHREIIRYAAGNRLGALLDGLVTFFLFGGLAAMLAGAGAAGAVYLGAPAWAGSVIMAGCTAATVLAGLSGVVSSLNCVVPVLLLSLLGISLATALNGPPDFGPAPAARPGGLIGHWLWAAILYTSYNTLLSAAVLGPLGAAAEDSRAVWRGAVLGGAGLGVGAGAIYLALLTLGPGYAGSEVPMLEIAARLGPKVQTWYAAVLLAEVYTTAVGSLYGISARAAGATGLPTALLVGGITAGAMGASRFGFANLVRCLYPVMGYGGLVLLLTLILADRRISGRRAP